MSRPDFHHWLTNKEWHAKYSSFYCRDGTKLSLDNVEGIDLHPFDGVVDYVECTLTYRNKSRSKPAVITTMQAQILSDIICGLWTL